MKLTVAELKAIPALQDVPDDQLQWLIDSGEVTELQPGDLLFDIGDPINVMMIVLEGSFRICVMQGSKLREIAVVKKDGITGYLPFSRATTAFGYAECMKPARIFRCHADQIKAGIRL